MPGNNIKKRRARSNGPPNYLQAQKAILFRENGQTPPVSGDRAARFMVRRGNPKDRQVDYGRGILSASGISDTLWILG
jgi:hypothetical protein